MKIKIGSKYKKTKKELERKIIEGDISILEINPEFNCFCYFCGKEINQKSWLLVNKYSINKIEHEDRYFIDDECYKRLIAQLN